jgi:hypothetical protein
VQVANAHGRWLVLATPVREPSFRCNVVTSLSYQASNSQHILPADSSPVGVDLRNHRRVDKMSRASKIGSGRDQRQPMPQVSSHPSGPLTRLIQTERIPKPQPGIPASSRLPTTPLVVRVGTRGDGLLPAGVASWDSDSRFRFSKEPPWAFRAIPRSRRDRVSC